VAAELKKEFGLDTKLVRGDGGIFDVKVNGKLIYTKAKTFSFPEPGEITKLIQAG
jgi:predicted Rdx family selenoprotein